MTANDLTSRPLDVLVLGGTGFLGSAVVAEAVRRGHRVASFSRGVRDTNPGDGVERLVGDRDGDLDTIRDRDWDAVIDIATFGPRWIRTLGEAIADRVRHYTFVSTIDVYDRPEENASTDESARVLAWDEDADPSDLAFPRADSPRQDGDYGVLKAICEREAERWFPERTLVVRPGYIVGANDAQERFTYWVSRLARGGHVLAPGDPRQPVQFVDLRDLTAWLISAVESGLTGPYNTLGPDGTMGLAELLGGIRSIFSVPTRLTWVSLPWIGRQSIVDAESSAWMTWRFSRDDAIDSGKAAAAGFRCRPLAETARWVHDWYAGLDDDRTSGPAVGVDRIPWDDFLARERDILARWATHRGRIG